MDFSKPGDRHKLVLDSPFNHTVKSVLHVLVNHWNMDKGGWRLKVATIAKEGGMGKTAARDAIRALDGLSLLKVTRTRSEKHGGNTSNFYAPDLGALRSFKPESLPLSSPHVKVLAPQVKADTRTLVQALKWWRDNHGRMSAEGMPKIYSERRPILARWVTDPEAVGALRDAYFLRGDRTKNGWREAEEYMRLLLASEGLRPWEEPGWWTSPDTARPFLRLALAAMTWADVGAARYSGETDRSADLWAKWDLGVPPPRPKLPEEKEAERQQAARQEAEQKAARQEAEQKAARELMREVQNPGFVPHQPAELRAWRSARGLSQAALSRAMRKMFDDAPAQGTLSAIERETVPFSPKLAEQLTAWIASNPPELAGLDGAPPSAER